MQTRKVKQKNQKDQQRRPVRRTRPSALIVKPNEGKSYADILNKMKSAPSLQEMGHGVTRVRKTQTGDILLVLNKSGQERTNEFSAAIEYLLGTVSSRTQQVTLEVTRLDGTTTKHEVWEAIAREVGQGHKTELDNMLSLRETVGGTRTAVLKLPAEAAKELLKKNIIRINWSNCRVREVMQPIKCYKCWHYGHISRKCISQTDRSSCCIRCGMEGHKVRECGNSPCCLPCRENGNVEVSHIPGSKKCPVYMKAYQTLLQKWR